MKVKKDLVCYIIIEVLLFILVSLAVITTNSLAKEIYFEKAIGMLSILNCLFFFLMIKRIRNEFLSIATLFVAFMYLFNLGMPISRLMGWIDKYGEGFLDRRIYSLGLDTVRAYLLYAFFLISFLQIGILYYNSNIRVSKKRVNYDFQMRKCKIIGQVLIVIGIIPYVYQEYMTIINAVIYGYQNENNTFNLSGTGIGLIGGLFNVGIMFILISTQKKKKRFATIVLVLSGYQLLRMYITGDRSTGVALIVVWLLIWHNYVSPIAGKRLVILGIFAYVGMIFIKLVEMTRKADGMIANEALKILLQSNMLAETVFEYGGNVWSGMMVYHSVPNTGAFRYGLTYLAGIIGKPFSILNITDSIWKFADFSVFLRKPERGGLINSLTASMGGSFSGEWYFNFGWIGIIIIPFFGYFLGKFSDACMNRKNNPCLSAYLLYIATLIIWWVRQYFTSVSWLAIFYGCTVWILYQIISKRLNRIHLYNKMQK